MKFCCRRSIKTSHLLAILSYGPCCRSDMKRAKTAVESASVDKNCTRPIRATKMNTAAGRLFVDFLFGDEGCENRFGWSLRAKRSNQEQQQSWIASSLSLLAKTTVASLNVRVFHLDHGLTATMPSI